MTRIGGTDSVLLLLQEQIARLAKDRAKAGRTATAGAKPPLARLRALAKREGLSDEDLDHALIRSVLIDSLGEALGNDPRFEVLAADVVRIIAGSDDGRALLAEALQRLGKG